MYTEEREVIARKYLSSLKELLNGQDGAPSSSVAFNNIGAGMYPDLKITFDFKDKKSPVRIMEIVKLEKDKGVPLNSKFHKGGSPVVISFAKGDDAVLDKFLDGYAITAKANDEAELVVNAFRQLIEKSGGKAGGNYKDLKPIDKRLSPYLLQFTHTKEQIPEQVFRFCEAIGLTPYFVGTSVNVSLNPKSNYTEMYYDGLEQFFGLYSKPAQTKAPVTNTNTLSVTATSIGNLFAGLPPAEQSELVRMFAPHLLPDENVLRDLLKEDLKNEIMPDLRIQITKEITPGITDDARKSALTSNRNLMINHFASNRLMIIKKGAPIKIGDDGIIQLSEIKIEDILPQK